MYRYRLTILRRKVSGRSGRLAVRITHQSVGCNSNQPISSVSILLACSDNTFFKYNLCIAFAWDPRYFSHGYMYVSLPSLPSSLPPFLPPSLPPSLTQTGSQLQSCQPFYPCFPVTVMGKLHGACRPRRPTCSTTCSTCTWLMMAVLYDVIKCLMTS